MINRWKSILLMHTFWTMWALESSVPFHSELRLFSVHWSVIEWIRIEIKMESITRLVNSNRDSHPPYQSAVFRNRCKTPKDSALDGMNRITWHRLRLRKQFPFPPRKRCGLNEFRDCRTIFPMAHTIYIAEKWTENFQSSPLLAMNVININTE